MTFVVLHGFGCDGPFDEYALEFVYVMQCLPRLSWHLRQTYRAHVGENACHKSVAMLLYNSGSPCHKGPELVPMFAARGAWRFVE